MFKQISTVLFLLALWWLSGVATTHAATIQLPRTGQTSCYGPDPGGGAYPISIPCNDTGQDGDIQAGTPLPSQRFTDNGDQTVTDALTGLIWTKDLNLMKTRDPSFDADYPFYDGMVTWQHALDYIKKLNTESYLGHNDWRLPNRNELKSLVNLQQPDQTAWLNQYGFTNAPSGWHKYWTSSSCADKPNYAWTIDSQYGWAYSYDDLSAKISNNYVWPVRAGGGGVVALSVTGQTACYDATGSVVSCSGSGQDGELQKGVVWPSTRFIDNGDQTVTDNLTGMVWSKDANSPGPPVCGPAITKTWYDTLNYVKCLNQNSYLGKTDWRLPNLNELASLLSLGQANNATWLNSEGFTNVQANNYHSSSDYIGVPEGYEAWFVGMDDSILTSINNYIDYRQYPAWPVRGGQVVNPLISASPATKDFGSVTTNSTSSAQTFTISNGGTENMVVSGITTTGGDSGMFSISAGNGTGGTCGSLTPTIAIGASCNVSVTFTPMSSGARATTLRIATNDRKTPSKDIALTGIGVGFSISTTVVGGNGTISCTSPVSSGNGTTCTITPAPSYYLATFTDNTVNKLSSITGNSYTITNVTADHAVQGTFAITIGPTVTPTTGTGFTITPATPQTVNANATTSFTITPASGYGIASVSGCGGNLSGSVYTTGAVSANCTVSVTAVARSANSGTSGAPTISDALKVLQAVAGITQLTPTEKVRYDVAPLGGGGVPAGNGVIDAADVIMILRRSIGIGSW